MKLLGREPALIISAIGAVVTFLVALKLDNFDAGAGAAVVTFLTAIVIAVTTRPVAPALFTAVISAGAALVAEYGLHLSDELVASLSGLVLVGFSLLSRAQVTPASDPRPV